MKLSEDDLLKSNASIFEKIIANLPGFVYWKNINSVYMGCNNNLAMESGLNNPQEIIGKTDYDFFWGKKQGDQFVLDDKEVIQTKAKKITEYKIPAVITDKKYRYIRTEKSPLIYNDMVIGVLAVAVDITTEVEAQQVAREVKIKMLEIMQGKIDAMSLIGASIAHELRTPLAAITIYAGGIQDYLPKLISTYQTAQQHQLEIPALESDELQMLSISLDDIQSIVKDASTFINMQLIKLDPNATKESSVEICSAIECINEALEQYPFQENEKYLVHWGQNANLDFKFKGNSLLFKHVIFNLLKNALYYLGSQGEIYIRIDKDKKYNKIYFRDTGQGISAAILPHIFDKFFSNTRYGAGVGLTFCQQVMQGFGGRIKCSSVESQYTEFALYFPIISQ